MIFNEINSEPLDRQMLCKVENQGVENILTLGACSYISNTGAEFDRGADLGGAHPSHILIGRYSSLASGMRLLMAFNHSYKGATSTFPFEDRPRIQKIISKSTKFFEPVDYPPNLRAYENRFQLIIGHDVWIGLDSLFVGAVNVGNGAIIGAGSVIAKDVPPYAVVVGNPARVIKYRFDDTTIKKLLAIKWWNWSLEKIADNLPLMKDVEKFLAAHWSPELENIPTDEIGWQVENFRAQGFKIYNFVADFQAKKPLWLRVIAGFCQSNFTDAKLIIWLVENSSESDFKLLAEAAKLFDNGAIKNILVVENEKISPYALRSATHFITNREMVTLECLDWLWNTNVKIVSALDDGIFDGEPLVDWKNLYC